VVDIKTLLPELKDLVIELAEDLLARVTCDAKIDAGLREAFEQIEKGGRTAQAYEVWREDYLDQVAVAWVLACVFVRFMEDNLLIDECWLAGEGDRRRTAQDTHELFFREHPHDTDREYFQHIFKEVGKIPAAKDLFAKGKTPLWAVAPSGDAAMKLLKFWGEMDGESGHLKRFFEVEPGDTRFLGDLYQDLSERARKKYALLQTPVFVEEFILDRTLTPALADFGLEDVRMIDPTCGSGHFLLGGFTRLFDLWSQRESNEIKAVQKALDGVWGVDINPFAVEIARFRLIVAAVQACGIQRLKQAPGWKIHLATGDSLLFGNRWNSDGTKRADYRRLDDSWAPDIYACEEKEAVQEILGQQYHVVVGNPPYIIVRDRTLNAAYRDRYSTCHQKYSLAVPFAERFFDLCWTTGDAQSGYVGMITANSFMKREFGKKLIEEFFPKIELTHVIDTSGAYIPGHGTPTVILFGRNRRPICDVVRAVLGIKGEPSTPEDPSQGKVWQSILGQIDRPNSQDEFISTGDIPRTTFNVHPWSIGGGGAAELKERLDDAASKVVADLAESVGITAVTGEDEVYVFPHRRDAERLRVQNSFPLVLGDMIRDHVMAPPVIALWPYTDDFSLRDDTTIPDLIRVLWPCKTTVSQRRRFGTPMLVKGAKWYEWQELYDDKLHTPLSIVFGEVTTHNHFLLDRGNKVFNRTAPIIKLSAEATEDDHLALVGLLNSSTACFWLKQVCHNKGSTVDQHGARQRTDPFEDFYAFNSTRVSDFRVPEVKPLALSRELDTLGQRYSGLLPEMVVSTTTTPTVESLSEFRTLAATSRARMIALQEELDWQCYELYGLLSGDLRHSGDDLPEVALGERAFEIVMARQMASGELETTWFVRHSSMPVTEIPTHWPAAYRKLVERRIKVIETNKEIALIEKPEYKRRWNDESWQEQEQRALKIWLLDRLETSKYRKGTKDNPELTTTAQMADVASADAEFLQVAALYRGRPDFDVAALVAELVEGEAVPFLPILRYKPAGLRKRELWERTWELQRQEDAGEDVGEIAVPPKYATADFLRTDFFRLRGKLDVPKERWISFPHCSTDSDPTLAVGWAGCNHLEQATALIAYYDARKREGWDAKRLSPLLAGIDQLLPWIHQWHPEIAASFGETAGQSFQTMLKDDAHELGLTLEDIRNWQPPATTARRRRARMT
jgi:hypothetical protein